MHYPLNTNMTREDFLFICNGNEYAADFVQAYVAKAHLLDDWHDKDKTIYDREIVKVELAFLEQLMINPWVRERQALLWPLIVVGMNAWLDSNRWQESRNKQLVEDAHVVKGIYHELVWWIAFLCGGQEHMNKVTSKYRAYDHERN